jgi:hypothetical protein
MNRDNRVTTIYGIAILGVGSALFIPVISSGSSLSRDLLLTIRARRIWQPSIHRGRLARAIDPAAGLAGPSRSPSAVHPVWADGGSLHIHAGADKVGSTWSAVGFPWHQKPLAATVPSLATA